MKDWKSRLRADPLPWLLEVENPSVRYFTLIDILGLDPQNKQAVASKKEIINRGVVKALKALAEIPLGKRSREVDKTIERAAEYLLQHHIYKRSLDLRKIVKPKWLRFGFPTMWDSDALEVLALLTRLGYKDTRMQEAVDLVLTKQDERGRWVLENTFNGRVQMNIEQKGKPSKWVTLNALRALRGFFS